MDIDELIEAAKLLHKNGLLTDEMLTEITKTVDSRFQNWVISASELGRWEVMVIKLSRFDYD